MAITIMPRDYNPWVQALPSFLQNIAIQKISQNFRGKLEQEERDIRAKERVQDRKYQVEAGTAQLQQAGYVESEAHIPDVEYGGKGYMQPKQVVDFKEVNGQIVPVYSQKRYGKEAEFTKTGTAIKAVKPQALIGQYNFSMQQYLSGKGKYPGSFTEWKKSVSRAGATKISIGEKIAQQEATSNLKIRQEVKQIGFEDSTIKLLKAESPDTWEYKPEWERQELVFREMDRKIRVAYKDKEVVFDEDRKPPGWYVGNKLIRRWVDSSTKNKPAYFKKHGKN